MKSCGKTVELNWVTTSMGFPVQNLALNNFWKLACKIAAAVQMPQRTKVLCMCGFLPFFSKFTLTWLMVCQFNIFALLFYWRWVAHFLKDKGNEFEAAAVSQQKT